MNESEIVKNVLRSDRRKMWIWGILCVMAWVIAVMLPWGFLLPMIAKIAVHVSQQQTQPKEAAETLELLQAVKIGTMGTMLGNLLTMLAAAGCTIAFVIVSRRATLRQLHAALADISQQLRDLKRP